MKIRLADLTAELKVTPSRGPTAAHVRDSSSASERYSIRSTHDEQTKDKGLIHKKNSDKRAVWT